MDTDPLAKSADWLENWRPTFETYLSSEVSRSMGEVVSFKLVKADGSIPIRDIVSNEVFDFYFTAPQFVACLEAQFSVQPLLTIRKYLPGGGESNVYAGIIVASASNQNAESIQDIKDSVVGIEGVSAWGSSLLQQETMRLNGLSLFRDAKQVITGIYFRSLQSAGKVHYDQADILERKRDIDFGFVRAEIIAGLEGANATRSAYFKRIGSWTATMPGTSKPYPFPVASGLFPEWSLLAYPHVLYETKLAVLRALLQINRTSPEAIRARYAAWQLADVYQGVVDVLDAMQARPLRLLPAFYGGGCRCACAGLPHLVTAACVAAGCRRYAVT
jgi:hypothetical protein